MKKRYNPTLHLFLFALLFSGSVIWGQQDPHFSLYRFHMNMINPAVSGIQSAPQLNMNFRSQWQGFEDAPETQVVSFATPTRGERVGLGINVVHDQSNIEKQTFVFGSFSYRLPLNDDLDLYLGLQAGTNGYSVKARELVHYGPDANLSDPSLQDYSNFNPNVGVGIYIKHDQFYFSLSAPKILKTTRFKENNGVFTEAADRVHFYGSSGLYIPINNQWEFVPSFLVRYVNFSPFLITTNASLSYKRILDFGIEYSFESGIGGTLMLDTGKTFSFGYAYITSMHPEINQFSKGTHEAMLRIKLGRNIKNQTAEELASEIVPPRNERRIGTRNNNTNTINRNN